MKTIKTLCRMAALFGIGFAAWKLVRHWRAGAGKKTGQVIDASIGAAAQKVEKTAVALEAWADSGLGENLGKGLDEVLGEAKSALDMATDIVQRSLKHTK